MKRIAILLVLAVVSISTYAQTKEGDSSFGLTLGGAFEDVNHFTLGLDYRYNFTDEIRFSPGITYFVKNDHWSTWSIDANAHFIFPLSDYFGFYPLAGANLSFWRVSAGGWSKNHTRVGGNIGLGAEMYATRDITLGIEFKYLIVKDFDQPMVGLRIGYNF